MGISDWSSDVCSSDLSGASRERRVAYGEALLFKGICMAKAGKETEAFEATRVSIPIFVEETASEETADSLRSEEHTSELQSLMRTSYAVFCLTIAYDSQRARRARPGTQGDHHT